MTPNGEMSSSTVPEATAWMVSSAKDSNLVESKAALQVAYTYTWLPISHWETKQDYERDLHISFE